MENLTPKNDSRVFTSQEIIDSINNYLSILHDDASLLDLYAQGNWFYYDFTDPSNNTVHGHVHAYPGIFRQQLYFFMIPAEYDNQAHKDELATYTQCCLVQGETGNGEGMGSHRIPDDVAEERINDWVNYHNDYIPLQVPSEDGMFKAFSISKQDFETQSDVVFLGLVPTIETSVGFEADLVVANLQASATAIIFDDYVKTVPPFSSTAQQEGFYLLTI